LTGSNPGQRPAEDDHPGTRTHGIDVSLLATFTTGFFTGQYPHFVTLTSSAAAHRLATAVVGALRSHDH
jgi:hypothetical protein